MKHLYFFIYLLVSGNIASAQQNKIATEKLSPSLKNRPVTLTDTARQTFWLITSLPDSARNIIKHSAGNVHVIQEYSNAGLLVVSTTRKYIDSLLISPYIRYADIPRKAKEEQAIHTQDFSVNTISKMQHDYGFADGNGLVASIKENRPDTGDIDLKGRLSLTPLSSKEFSTHATQMATTIGGGGNSFYTGKGIAPASLLTSSSFASVLPDADAAYIQYNVSVQNHSYGTAIESYYGADAVAYDASVNTNPSLLHVFSAGNSGISAPASGTYIGIDSVANLTGSFKMAKNIITVGATDSFNTVAILSSKGPAYDGRIKPELVAFGQDGSSGAAAIVSGIAISLQHAYKLNNNNQLPPAALVKAILINSAADVDIPGPDFKTGYGAADGFKAIKTLLKGQYINSSVNDGKTQSFNIIIPPGIKIFKATLCWTDVPAAPNAPKALVNDLDLQLKNSTTNQYWLPWVLSTYPKRDSLIKPAIRTRDTLNNTEQITIDYPTAGNYSIEVIGVNTHGSVQSFSIAYEADSLDQFTWMYPTSTDYLVGGTKNVLRWNNTYANTYGSLYYSIDNGNTWQQLSNQVLLKQGYFAFETGETFSTALFKMTVNGKDFVSDTCTVSNHVKMMVGFNCPDSLQLYWNSIPGALGYNLYYLGPRYLQTLLTTSDTSVILSSSQLSGKGYHFTVAPILKPLQEGIKANTINYTMQGAGCYINNLLGQLREDNTALLTLSLGSLYQVSSIALEKYSGNGFTSLYTFPNNNLLQYNFTDNSLHHGGNIYRGRVTLQNGKSIYSNPETVYSYSRSNFLVFPNPLSGGAVLQIQSMNLYPKTVLLYNALGQCIKRQPMNNASLNLSTTTLSKGIYWLMILQDGKVEFKTAVVVQ